MPDIRYICLSDLHFGAQNSILTRLLPDSGDVDVDEPSAVMTGLFDCLGALISRNESSQRPTLILCGDILEFALADQNVAAMAFELFASRAFSRNGQLFDDIVFFIPGNHDHHLWESARERHYARYVAASRPDQHLAGPRHTTGMLAEIDPEPLESDFLGSLVHRQLQGGDVTVRTVYPNLALRSADRSRIVVFSHGHFVERMYLLMSELEDMLFPARREGEVRDHIGEWEADNFAWIDFLWSTLGRSGQAGEAVRLIYTSLESEEVLRSLAGNLARGLAARTPGPPWLHTAETPVLARALSVAIRRAVKFERTNPAAPLSTDAQDGLQTYLEHPVHDQIRRELDLVPSDVTFVFGHTHKPFASQRRFAGYGGPVRLYNTGGWVIDSLKPQPAQGARSSCSMRISTRCRCGSTTTHPTRPPTESGWSAPTPRQRVPCLRGSRGWPCPIASHERLLAVGGGTGAAASQGTRRHHGCHVARRRTQTPAVGDGRRTATNLARCLALAGRRQGVDGLFLAGRGGTLRVAGVPVTTDPSAPLQRPVS